MAGLMNPSPTGNMIPDENVKAQVREFYDSVGWQQIGAGIYQNARYEDLRPVSREYIQKCHLRVNRYLPNVGRFILDAGSGPVQYPEYLTYSEGFQARVCLDISIRALREARTRLGDHGLYVVGDIAHLPFKSGAFDALISMHAVHHLPLSEHKQAFFEFKRMLGPGGKAVVVSSWGQAPMLMRIASPAIRIVFSLLNVYRRLAGRDDKISLPKEELSENAHALLEKQGTFIAKHDYAWAREELKELPGFEIRVWRSVNNSFLRAFIHRRFFGTTWLRVLYSIEERAPHLMGRIGQYPMILFRREGRVSGSLGGGEGR
jgi:ubiquinone/menaquinone biosynthesis C-methylase UbiE